MYVCVCVRVIKKCCYALVSHNFLSETMSLNLVVLTGLFLIWTFCVFMINLHITELHNKPVAACPVCVCVVVIFLLVPMCVCLKEAGAARAHIKQCCWTLLCVNLYTALPPQPFPLCLCHLLTQHIMLLENVWNISVSNRVLYSLSWLVQLNCKIPWKNLHIWYQIFIADKQTGSASLLSFIVTEWKSSYSKPERRYRIAYTNKATRKY